jgi:hypothetical protein
MKRTSRYPRALGLAAALLLCSAAAEAAVTVTVTGPSTARADFALGGTPAVPQYTGTLFLEFEAPIALTAANLGISAQIVNPSDPAFAARLPAGGQVTVSAGFPVMVSVDPPAAGGFEFINAARVELYTTRLSYTPNTPYRLYKASAGQPFYDLTEDVFAGSIRSRARTGGFSDFIILSDNRTPYQAVLDSYAALNGEVGDDGIDPLTRAAL